jgi:ABC-type nitrate/sulfonate/bicarbonate transport system substrate-binding protein
MACGGSSAGSQTLTKLSVGLGGPDASAAPLYVAYQKGWFKQEGVDVSINNTMGNTLNSVVAGQSDIAECCIAATLVATNQGKPMSLITAVVGGGEVGLMVGTVDSPSKCTRMSTGFPGGTVLMWTMRYQKLLKAKWDIIQNQDPSQIPNLVISGQANCAVLTSTIAAAGLNAGKFHVLIDPSKPSTLPPGFPQGILEVAFWGAPAHLKAEKTAVTAFLRAWLKAVAFIKQAPPEQVATILRENPDWKTLSQEQVIFSVQDVKPYLAPRSGYITTSSWPDWLDFIKEAGETFVDPADPKFSYKNMVDMSYYRSAGGQVPKE